MMSSIGAHTRSRNERVWPGLALASLLLLASCALEDPVEPTDCECPDQPIVGARLSNGHVPHFYVSPSGSPSGDGSFQYPWDLATALSGPAAVTPGSTIWLREGIYADGPHFGHGYLSELSGTPDAPIVVRQFPGERATVTKFLFVQGAHTWYWGLEVVHPAPHVGRAFGFDVRGPGTKLINVVVHDANASGIFIWPEATDAEVYGTISYNNGRTDNRDHGIYCQSQSSLLLNDNIVFDNWSYGIHCFAEDGPNLRNIHLEGNVSFNNYAWGGTPGAEILVGGHVPAFGTVVKDNYTYRTSSTNTMTAEIGHGNWVNEDVVSTGNYFVGGWWYMGHWTAATVTGNTLYNFTTAAMVWNRGLLTGHRWSGNTFFGDETVRAWRYGDDGLISFDGWRALTGFADAGAYAGAVPTGVKVVVRPNRYEAGRANIIVYNWDRRSTVGVDVSGILEPGDSYVVQHAQDFYGEPPASGIYTGGLLDLPMVAVTPPLPLGVDATGPAPVTGPIFNVFVLLKTEPRQGPCPPVWHAGPGSCGPQSRMNR